MLTETQKYALIGSGMVLAGMCGSLLTCLYHRRTRQEENHNNVIVTMQEIEEQKADEQENTVDNNTAILLGNSVTPLQIESGNNSSMQLANLSGSGGHHKTSSAGCTNEKRSSMSTRKEKIMTIKINNDIFFTQNDTDFDNSGARDIFKGVLEKVAGNFDPGVGSALKSLGPKLADLFSKFGKKPKEAEVKEEEKDALQIEDKKEDTDDNKTYTVEEPLNHNEIAALQRVGSIVVEYEDGGKVELIAQDLTKEGPKSPRKSDVRDKLKTFAIESPAGSKRSSISNFEKLETKLTNSDSIEIKDEDGIQVKSVEGIDNVVVINPDNGLIISRHASITETKSDDSDNDIRDVRITYIIDQVKDDPKLLEALLKSINQNANAYDPDEKDDGFDATVQFHNSYEPDGKDDEFDATVQFHNSYDQEVKRAGDHNDYGNPDME